MKLPIIDTTSPSTNEQLRVCQLKAGFSRLKQANDFVLSHPKSWMGAIIHDILFEAAGCPGSIDVDELWKEKVLDVLDKARKHPLNQRFDDAERWPGYHLLLSGLRSFVKKFNYKNQRERSQSVHREVEIVCFGGKLKGRPDYFDSDQLIDYKTGVITEPDTDGQAKEAYVRQLKIYAAIIYEGKKYWVSEASLVPVSGPEIKVAIDSNDCMAEAREAVELLDRYNTAVNSGTVTGSPSETACMYCPFQLICPDFWSTVNDNWSESVATQTIQGKLLRPPFPIRSTTDYSLAIETTRGTMPAGTYTVRVGSAQLKSAEPLVAGSELRISGLKRVSAGNALGGSLYTVIWRLDQIRAVTQ